MSIIDHRHLLYFRMLREPFDVVRTAFIQRARVENDRELDTLLWLEERGFEEVDVPAGVYITDDGRPVYRHGKKATAMALRKDIFERELKESFDTAKKRQDETAPETKSVIGTESMSAMVCPKCGDSLQHTTVCPKCAAGKLGYRHRYTCVCGGVDLISKEII